MVDADGKELQGACSGNLCLINSWPGQMRTVYGDHQRFIDTYFKTYPGKYFTGKTARGDEDGYYWTHRAGRRRIYPRAPGRSNKMPPPSRVRAGAALLAATPGEVAEAAVVTNAPWARASMLCATLKAGQMPSGGAGAGARWRWAWRAEIGSDRGTPDVIQWAPGLARKTRSGKIMRRISEVEDRRERASPPRRTLSTLAGSDGRFDDQCRR